MEKYDVKLSSTAFKALKSMPNRDLQRAIKMIKSLEIDPFPHGSIKLSGLDKVYRVRFGDYRIIYEVDNNVLTVLVLKIGHRKDIYR